MGIFDWFRRADAAEPVAPRAEAGGTVFEGLDLKDPVLAEFLRGGLTSAAGIEISVDRAMRNPAVFRSVALLSNGVGMLPLHLIRKDTKEKATTHPLYRVLHRRPNGFQSAFDFRALMQLRALVYGDGYAKIVRSIDLRTQKPKVTGLLPLDPTRIQPSMEPDWTVRYRYQPEKGGEQKLLPEDVFHLRGVSLNGLNGICLVRQAADAIGLAIAAELAMSRLYKNGSFVNGVLKHPGRLSGGAKERLRDSWDQRYAGADKAGKTPLLEEGLTYEAFGANAKDAQSNETRARQVEEIARIFGIPRPLLMVDETSWGSGIEQLGLFFVQYGLSPWFEAWQQAVERSLLREDEVERFEVKFNAGALLRGSVKDQAEFFAQALGSGGHQPWMTAEEVREAFDLPPDVKLPPAPGQQAQLGHNGGPPLEDGTNDNGQAA